jgi:uncharacterized membrane protein YdjX (TVP38/TMEM64 family)
MARDPFLALFDRREVVRAWVQSFGALAPLAYIALYIGQIILPPLPGHFMGLMGGYLFGAGWGLLYSLISVGLGAGLATSVARHLGRPAILRLAGEQQLRDWERRLRVRSPLTWWLLFLFPVPDVIYYIAGLGGVPLHRLLIAALAGRTPALIVSNWLGAQAINLPPLLFWGSLAFVAAVVVVIYRYQREVRWLALMALRYARRLVRKRTS